MAGRQSAQADKALRYWQKNQDVYKAAKRFGVAPSTIYRAIKRNAALQDIQADPEPDTIQAHGSAPDPGQNCAVASDPLAE